MIIHSCDRLAGKMGCAWYNTMLHSYYRFPSRSSSSSRHQCKLIPTSWLLCLPLNLKSLDVVQGICRDFGTLRNTHYIVRTGGTVSVLFYQAVLRTTISSGSISLKLWTITGFLHTLAAIRARYACRNSSAVGTRMKDRELCNISDIDSVSKMSA